MPQGNIGDTALHWSSPIILRCPEERHEHSLIIWRAVTWPNAVIGNPGLDALVDHHFPPPPSPLSTTSAHQPPITKVIDTLRWLSVNTPGVADLFSEISAWPARSKISATAWHWDKETKSLWRYNVFRRLTRPIPHWRKSNGLSALGSAAGMRENKGLDDKCKLLSAHTWSLYLAPQRLCRNPPSTTIVCALNETDCCRMVRLDLIYRFIFGFCGFNVDWKTPRMACPPVILCLFGLQEGSLFFLLFLLTLLAFVGQCDLHLLCLLPLTGTVYYLSYCSLPFCEAGPSPIVHSPSIDLIMGHDSSIVWFFLSILFYWAPLLVVNNISYLRFLTLDWILSFLPFLEISPGALQSLHPIYSASSLEPFALYTQ